MPVTTLAHSTFGKSGAFAAEAGMTKAMRLRVRAAERACIELGLHFSFRPTSTTGRGVVGSAVSDSLHKSTFSPSRFPNAVNLPWVPIASYVKFASDQPSVVSVASGACTEKGPADDQYAPHPPRRHPDPAGQLVRARGRDGHRAGRQPGLGHGRGGGQPGAGGLGRRRGHARQPRRPAVRAQAAGGQVHHRGATLFFYLLGFYYPNRANTPRSA